jgi:O-antigen/teichoic acid export membrane protein
LGADSFGQYSAVLAFVAAFTILSDLGLSPYAVRQFARWREESGGESKIRNLYANVLVIRLILSIVTVIIVTLAALVTGRPLIMVGAIVISALSLILYGVQGSSESVLTGYERLDIPSTAKVFNQLIFVVIGGVLLWLGFGYYGLIIASLIGAAALTYICWRSVKNLGINTGKLTPTSWGPLLKAALPFGIIGFALGLSYRFDTILLNIFRGDAETGYYNAAYNLIFSFIVISNALNVALYPSLARQSVSDPQRLPEIYSRSLRYLMIIALPITIGVFVLADQIVVFLYESAYLQTAPALKILIMVLPLMFVSEFLGYIVVIANQESRVARAIVISTALNISLNLLLVPRYGFIAAAWMTVITEFVLVTQYLYYLRAQVYQLNWIKNVVYPFLAALFMGVVVYYLSAYIPLIMNVLLGALIYTLLLLIFRVVGRDEFIFIQKLITPSKV